MYCASCIGKFPHAKFKARGKIQLLYGEELGEEKGRGGEKEIVQVQRGRRKDGKIICSSACVFCIKGKMIRSSSLVGSCSGAI